MLNPSFKRLLVTGGAGFIGSSFIRMVLGRNEGIEKLVNLDLLTEAANLKNLSSIEDDPRYVFVRGNILNGALVEELIRLHNIDAIIHFAAESHVDRSIENPISFYRTNVEGTLVLLELVRRFPKIHFHHVSTDEVFGSIESGEFTENSPYKPNSPYAASKAAADHFVRSYANTYGISVTISHSSNNYGPGQHVEKFIPRMLQGCFNKEKLPVYGDGKNVRDWIYVEDHVEAIWLIVNEAKRGEAYNIGGHFAMRNIDLLKQLIDRFAKKQGDSTAPYIDLITFITDRPGHDFRYALSSKKIQKELGWIPRHQFEQGIEKTIAWYIENLSCSSINQ